MPPVAPRPPVWWVAPRYQRVQPEPLLALAWGWHSTHCVVYAPGSVDEAWPKTGPRQPRAAPHAHPSRAGPHGWLLANADLVGGKPIRLCLLLHRLAVLTPLCCLPHRRLMPLILFQGGDDMFV